jgi:hypothetical protein
MGAQRRGLWVALGAYGLAALVLLLSPIGPGELVRITTSAVQGVPGLAGVRQGWVEFVANILLFVPLGFLLTGLVRPAWWGVVLALGLSVAAELVQVLLPARLASPRDVLANALGAAIGAALAWVVLIRRRPHGSPTATRRAR